MAILRLGNSNSEFSGSFSGSFQGDGSGLTGVGGSTGAFGISDSSGEYTYYSSLSASMAAAVSGDVVEVFADTVVSGSVALATTILFKNGVNIFGNGHTYTLDHSSSMAAFADYPAENTTTGTDISCSINEFNIRRISSDATSKAILIENRTSGKQTSLNLHGSTIHNTAGLAFRANYRNASVDGGHFYSDINGGAGFINANGGADTHPYTKNVHCHFPNGWSTVSSVDNSQFISEGDQSYTLTVTGRVSNCYVSSKGSGVTVLDSGTSSEILNCNIENVGSGIAVRGFGFVSNSTIYSNTSFAVRTLGNADCEIVNNRIYSKAYVALDQYTSYNGGRHNVSNNTIISDTSNTLYAAVQLQGASSNEFIFANNTVINNGDNANCHGIKLTNYDPSAKRTILANNTIKVFNTGANCISTTSAVTNAFLAGNIYDVASVAVHPLITQSFTNVPDEQGNIHLTSSLNNNRTYSGSFSGSYVGDGSGLTGVGGDAFPFTGDAQITGSLEISGSLEAFTRVSTNVQIGNNAGAAFTTAANSVIIGQGAGDQITTGTSNTIIGSEAGGTAGTGILDNVFIGYAAGKENTSDSIRNVFIGYQAGYKQSGGYENVGIGYRSMANFSTTGDHDYNSALGAYTLYSINTGQYNVAIGRNAGYAISDGDNNILIGRNAGSGITYGGSNIIIGSGSLGALALEQQLRIGNGNSLVTISASLETGDIIFANTASAPNFSGSFQGDGSNLTGISSTPFPFTGDAQITGSLVISASNNTSESLSIEGSGSTIFSIQGSQGQLFSVTDDLLDEVFSVADISGDTLLSVSGSGLVEIPVGNLSGSATATASFGYFSGSGAGLSDLPSSPAFPFTGDASITGSLTISGSFSSFTLDSDNIVLGAGAGGAMEASANSNVIIGPNAGAALTTGDYNIMVGDYAGQLTTTTTKNIFVGEQAGRNGLGNTNIGIGYRASRYGTASSLRNIGIGEDALYGNAGSDGTYNIGIGYRAGYSITDGTNNVILGEEAGYGIGNGNYNILIGHKSGNQISTGNNNIIIGSGSLGTTAMSDQLIIGNVDNVLISGSLATGDVIFASTASAAYFAGDGSQLTNLPASSTFPFTGDAQITGSLEITGSLKMIRPSNKLDLSIGSNIIIGREAGNSISDDRGAIFLGYKAGYTNTSPSSNIAIGYGAGGALGTNASANNIFMGYLAGAGNTSIGSITSRMSQASNNIGMGYQALLYLTSGDQNIALGTAVMRNISTGGNNTAFGAYALYNTDSGDNNIGIGYYAGLNQTSGDGNITIGSGSLGVAGESNQLRIGQGNGDALIHGDFASQSLSINGSGSTVFNVIGSQGTLFAVDDDLSGTLFTANDISGLPVLEASASGEVYIGKSPQSLYTTAVISSTSNAVTQSIFGLSTSSYDGAFFDYTVQSGSDARAGSIMSVWNGSTINFTETTTLDIGDTSGFNLIVHISQSQAQIAQHSDTNGYKIKTIIRSI